MSTVVLLRAVTSPLQFKMFFQNQRMSFFQEDVNKMKTELDSLLKMTFKSSEKMIEFRIKHAERMKTLLSIHGIQIFLPYRMMIIQAPLFLYAFFSFKSLPERVPDLANV